jgi:hypothetical protein
MRMTPLRSVLGTVFLAAMLAGTVPCASAGGFDFPAIATGFSDVAQTATLESDSHDVISGILSRAAVGRVGRRPVHVPPNRAAGFVPTASATRAARERLATALAAVQPTTSRATILRELNSGVIQAEFARQLRAARMTPHDMADVMTGFLVTAWEVTSGEAPSGKETSGKDPAPQAPRYSASQILGYSSLRNALRAEMAADPAWMALSSAQKQDAAETMTVLAMLALAARESLALHKDPARQEQLRTGVRDAVQAYYGVDLSSVQFTPAGFIPADVN